MSEWQDIATAPKGDLLLLYVPDLADDADRIVIGCSGRDGFVKFPHAWPVTPTHWMPLPEPPK